MARIPESEVERLKAEVSLVLRASLPSYFLPISHRSILQGSGRFSHIRVVRFATPNRTCVVASAELAS